MHCNYLNGKSTNAKGYTQQVHPPVEKLTRRRLRSIRDRSTAEGTRSDVGEFFLTAIWLVCKYQGLDVKRLLEIQRDPHQYSAANAAERVQVSAPAIRRIND